MTRSKESIRKRIIRSKLADYSGKHFVAFFQSGERYSSFNSRVPDDLIFGIVKDSCTYTLFTIDKVYCQTGDDEFQIDIEIFYDEFRSHGRKNKDMEFLTSETGHRVWIKDIYCYMSIFNILLYLCNIPTTFGGKTSAPPK